MWTPRIKAAARAYERRFGQLCPFHTGAVRATEDDTVAAIISAIEKNEPFSREDPEADY